jgi:predicted acyltransferase
VAGRSAAAAPPRLASIDALRGFDMFWITGGDALAIALGKWLGWAGLVHQMEHVEWEGFVFYDLIFPLFMFLVGVVLPYSLSRYDGRPRDAHLRIVRRAALLIFLGWVNWGLFNLDFENMRWPGVLQRIGLGYMFAAFAVLYLRFRGRVIFTAALLLGYWFLLLLVPAPGGRAWDLSMEGNLVGWLDRTTLPGSMCCYTYGDNEGILSTIPAIATVMLGVFAGTWLRSSRTPGEKAQGLVIGGLVSLVVGFLWWPLFPVIKNLWTSSYVMLAGGWSLLLLALFYWVIDVKGYRRWAFPFVVIGMNAITIYVLQNIVDFDAIGKFFVGGLASTMTAGAGAVLLALSGVAARWVFLRYLYAKGTFLRV